MVSTGGSSICNLVQMEYPLLISLFSQMIHELSEPKWVAIYASFHYRHITFSEMLQQIKTKGIKPFRPSLNHIRDIDKPEIIELMVTCWDDIFFKRPTFRHIKKQLRGITGYV